MNQQPSDSPRDAAPSSSGVPWAADAQSPTSAPGRDATVVKPDRFSAAAPPPAGQQAPGQGEPAPGGQGSSDSARPLTSGGQGPSEPAEPLSPGGRSASSGPYLDSGHGLEYQSPSTYVGPSGSNPPTPPLRPYGADTATGYVTPSKPRRVHLSTTVGLVALALNVVLIGIVVAMLVRWPSASATAPAPQASPSAQASTSAAASKARSSSAARAPATKVSQGGPTTIADAGFSITPPPGWGYHPNTGAGNNVKLIDGNYNKITVYSWKSDGPPIDFCDRQTRATQIWTEGTITALPEVPFTTGEPFPGFRLDSPSSVQLNRCLAHGGRVYNIQSEARPEDADAVSQAYDQVVASWSWA